jgi:hypothetical protein
LTGLGAASTLSEGKYSVWFKTPVGAGAGIAELGSEGVLTGGDPSFAYSGHWEQDGDRFRAAISSKRIADGPSVFGLNEVDITVTGVSSGGATASCMGSAKPAPNLKLEVTLVRMSA